MQHSKLVYSAKEVCQVLGICRTSFNKLRKLGVFRALPFLRRNERYPWGQITDYLNQAQQQKGNQP